MLVLSIQAARSELTSETNTTARANNAFAMDLYSRLAKQPGNFVVSPLSLDAALTMTYAGARGKTARQMAHVLHFENSDTNVHAGLSALLKDLQAANKLGCQLDIANALWVEKNYPFLLSYLAFLHDQYDASLNQYEKVADDEAKRTALRKEISSWVEGKTHDKIKDIIPPDLPSYNTRMILVNAIYFKGLWATPFNRKLTKDAPFHVSAEKFVSVLTMHVRTKLKYGENDGIQVLEMPYHSNRLSMVILLPRKNDGLTALEKTLTVSGIQQLLQTSTSQEVNVSLPKFTETTEFRLKETLGEMGMADAFSGDEADFSGIVKVRRLWIEDVLHKTYMSVDEEGTEAAAATAVFLEDSVPVMFSADHPFLFLIKDNSTGAILFMGRVTNPPQ